MMLAQICFSAYWYKSLNSFFFVFYRLQREEEEAYANRQQKSQPQAAVTPFNKFEERKNKEKSSKVHTVTKFFTPSTKTPPKKGTSCVKKKKKKA